MHIKIVWGESAPFEYNHQKTHMLYYGVFIGSVFIGIGKIINPPEIHWTHKMA